MRSSIFTTVRFVMALLTVLAVVGKPYIPPKSLLIHPHPDVISSIYGPSEAVDESAAGWLSEENYEWRCDYAIGYGGTNCGFTLSWNSGLVDGWHRDANYSACESAGSYETGDGWGWEDGRSCLVDALANPSHPRAAKDFEAVEHPALFDTGPTKTDGGAEALVRSIDFSQYDGLNVSIHYEGRANFLRLYLRNYNPLYSSAEDSSSSKFMATFLSTGDLKAGAAHIRLADFHVEEWWAMGANLSRALAGPEFDRIITVGVDHVEHGLHTMRVDRLELVGERVSMERFLTVILMLWGGFFLIEAALRYYYLYAASCVSDTPINKLTRYGEVLDQEKDLLETRTVTDSLTGVLNRAGVDQQMRRLYDGDRFLADFGVMMFDIDHFKSINDIHGRDAGDRILKELAKLIAANLQEHDIFGRWGGEEFLLVARYACKDSLMEFADRLRVMIAKHTFGPQVNVTVSIGVSKVRKGDTFSIAVKRADEALHQAKKTRNSVIYAE